MNDFGGTNSNKHCIKVAEPYLSPINFAPFRAGPRVRKFKKREIDEMFNMHDIEPEQLELASLIVFS